MRALVELFFTLKHGSSKCQACWLVTFSTIRFVEQFKDFHGIFKLRHAMILLFFRLW
jgi:hypothetical protein